MVNWISVKRLRKTNTSILLTKPSSTNNPYFRTKFYFLLQIFCAFRNSIKTHIVSCGRRFCLSKSFFRLHNPTQNKKSIVYSNSYRTSNNCFPNFHGITNQPFYLSTGTVICNCWSIFRHSCNLADSPTQFASWDSYSVWYFCEIRTLIGFR